MSVSVSVYVYGGERDVNGFPSNSVTKRRDESVLLGASDLNWLCFRGRLCDRACDSVHMPKPYGGRAGRRGGRGGGVLPSDRGDGGTCLTETDQTAGLLTGRGFSVFGAERVARRKKGGYECPTLLKAMRSDVLQHLIWIIFFPSLGFWNMCLMDGSVFCGTGRCQSFKQFINRH